MGSDLVWDITAAIAALCVLRVCVKTLFGMDPFAFCLVEITINNWKDTPDDNG